jgi:hypothetical protein
MTHYEGDRPIEQTCIWLLLRGYLVSLSDILPRQTRGHMPHSLSHVSCIVTSLKSLILLILLLVSKRLVYHRRLIAAYTQSETAHIPRLPTTMSPKKKLKMTVEAAPEVSVHQSRSAYGDNHASTENTLLTAHAQHLWKAGAIDEHMVTELSKPYYKTDVRVVRYTTEYLAAHPDYTGEDADTIPTLQTAMKHRRDRDEAQNKILEDYRARRIDVWGNPTEIQIPHDQSILLPCAQGSHRQYRTVRAYQGHDLDEREEEHTGDDSEAEDSSSGSCASCTTTGPRRHTDHIQETNAQAFIANASKLVADLPVKGTFSTATPQSFKQQLAQFRYNPDLLPSTIPSTVTSFVSPTRKTLRPTPPDHVSGASPNRTISISVSPARPSPQRLRKVRTVVPLQPLHGNSDYSELDYYKAAALCRNRSITSGGNVQEVRNHLIRDDIAVHDGSPRVMASTNYRKVYKTEAPSEDG